MASGQALEVARNGKRAAFSNNEKRRIIWAPQAYEIHEGNPYVARPGEESAKDLEWIINCSGHRPYAKQQHGRWLFREFVPPPGRIFFTPDEFQFAMTHGKSHVIVEPRVKEKGACFGVNKQWPIDRYSELVRLLRHDGIQCSQLVGPRQKPLLPDVGVIQTPTFRHAAAILQRSILYVGPEGGLHHAAAAACIPAVVIFGGFANPKSTGYNFHTNISVGTPCGQIATCPHCVDAMHSISVKDVHRAVVEQL